MADSQVKTANLFDADTWYGAYKQADGTYQTNRNTWYTLVAKPFTNDDIGKSFCFAANVEPSSGNARFAAVINGVQINGQYTGNRCIVTFTVQTIDDKIIFDYGSGSTTVTTVSNIMLNTGSQPLPYEPYGWQHSLRKLTTATDTITTLPADLYADGNSATVGLVGNMVQNGTPTPQNPIQPQECGDLETSGTKAGQYKIPISSANTTTPVYLGEVESTRKIKKQILTGTETVSYNGNEPSNRIMVVTLPTNETGTNTPSNVICTHFETKNTVAQTSSGGITMRSNGIDFVIGIGYDIINVDSDSSPVEVQNAFKAYLAAQYANGTPVTVWYVLATETTGIVNEPIRKIGDYADTVSGITIPTITGADSFDVLTTLKPSEVELTYTGWHDSSVKEWDGSQWQ